MQLQGPIISHSETRLQEDAHLAGAIAHIDEHMEKWLVTPACTAEHAAC